MTAHLHVPALDPTPNVGATLSAAMAQDLLQDELGFEGLVITDALDMKGVADHFPAAEVNRRALLAGNDLLLFCVDVPGSLDAIQRAVADGLIGQGEIDRRCRKLLQAKAWLGLDRFEMPAREGLIDDLNSAGSERINQRLSDAAVTSLRRPAATPDPARSASLALLVPPAADDDGLAHHQLTATASTDPGADDRTPFQQVLADAGVERHFRFELGQSPAAWDALLAALDPVDELIVGLHGLHMKAGSGFGVTEELCRRLEQLLATGKVSLCVFGNGYALRSLPDLGRAHGLLLTYQDMPHLQRAAARVMAGAAEPRGRDHLGLGDR